MRGFLGCARNDSRKGHGVCGDADEEKIVAVDSAILVVVERAEFDEKAKTS
jgi:hypothetical protein